MDQELIDMTMMITTYIIKNNEKLNKMQQIYNDCHDLGIDPPACVAEIIEDAEQIENIGFIEKLNSSRVFGEDFSAIIINVDDIPENTKEIAVVTSW